MKETVLFACDIIAFNRLKTQRVEMTINQPAFVGFFENLSETGDFNFLCGFKLNE